MRKSLILLLVFVVSNLFAQQSSLPRDEDRQLRSAIDLYDKKQYSAAQDAFKQAALSQSLHSERRKIAEY